MIKVNLATGKQQLDLSNVSGFDLTQIKVKAVAIVIVLMYLPDFFILPAWQTEKEVATQEVNALKSRLSKLKGEVNKAKDFEKQIEELKLQEQVLGQKLVAVKEAISIKKNPAALLLYVAKNTPKNLWIKEMVLEAPSSLTIKGEALDYSSIGEFVNSLRSSVFIKEANIVNTAAGQREDKTRIETFEAKFIIARFEQ